MRTIARHRSIVLFGAVTLVLPCSLRANLKSTVTRTKNPVDEIPHDVAKLVQWRKFSPSQSDFAPETATIDSHLSRWYGSPCSSLGAIYKGRQENERRIISKVPDTYTLVQKQENIMTQAAVDLAEGSGIFRKPVQASRKRKHSDDEEFSIEDDPSWEPRRKQRHTRHHSGNNSAARPSVHASGITVILTESSNEMWEHYRRLGTEMIICKEGRSVYLYFQYKHPSTITLMFLQENVSSCGNIHRWSTTRSPLFSFHQCSDERPIEIPFQQHQWLAGHQQRLQAHS